MKAPKNRFDLRSPRQAERLIAAARLGLASVALFAIWLDPTEPARFARPTYLLLWAYVVFSVGVLSIAGYAAAPGRRLSIFTHSVDLAVSALLVYLTEGYNSPFFALFTFSLVAATLRWQRRGLLPTALVAIAAFLGTGVYGEMIQRNPDFELNRFLIRSFYLVVVSLLLGALGEHEERMRLRLSSIALWEPSSGSGTRSTVPEILESVSRLLGARQAVLVRDLDAGEDRQIANWTPDGFHWPARLPESLRAFSDELLLENDFLCLEPGSSGLTVVVLAEEGFKRLQISSLASAFPVRPEFRSILSLGFEIHGVNARLYLMSRQRMSPDDLIFGRLVARQLAARIEQWESSARFARAAAGEERLRLARDLHDTLHQSLAGTALQIESLRTLVRSDPAAAEERLDRIQAILSAEQRDLRFFLRELRPSPETPEESEQSFSARVAGFCARFEAFWSLSVESTVDSSVETAPAETLLQVYRMIQEALVNAARHARAKCARLRMEIADGTIHLEVEDDGQGFPFRGRFDLAELDLRKIGPLSLKSRIRSLGGAFCIDSSATGSRLDIAIPLLSKES